MDEIGLFPLGIVLLPTEQVPLHIFEPRYRELITQCLEDDREFGLVFADEDGLRAIGTRAAVTEVLERFDDGRLNIVVEGGERFRLVEVNEGESFHTGEVEPVVDSPTLPTRGRRSRRSHCSGDSWSSPARTSKNRTPTRRTSSSRSCWRRGSSSRPVKQELLQTTSERLRLERLCELLENAVELVARQEEIAGRARTNGKVDPPEP